MIRDWRNYNKEAVLEALSTLNLEQISNASDLQDILGQTLNKVAPMVTVRANRHQLVNPKIEAIKKRRDRFLRKFKKSNNPEHLEKAKSFTKTLKKVVKKEARRVFQCKAVSPDPRSFWQAFNHTLGRHTVPIHEINDGNKITKDHSEIANIFSNFFSSKVTDLCPDTIDTSIITQILLNKPKCPLKIGYDELGRAIKTLSNKKSYGIDEIPQNLFKDSMILLQPQLLNILNGFCRNGLDDNLKTARVIPLHKKEDKKDYKNYRPISNLSVISKVYEKCLLFRLQQEVPDIEGDHQHGFRQHHSTVTALLSIQSKMAQIIDERKHGIIYSVDLSAAFDLLKPDKFIELFKHKLSEGLLFALADFLTSRKFVVEMGKSKSNIVHLDRGCVQGSILGPKLFSLYLFELEKHLGANCSVVSYADDTYVIVEGIDDKDTLTNLKDTLTSHINYLKSVGMVVNESKTELMWIGNTKYADTVEINGKTLSFQTHMKALGLIIESNLSWTMQAEMAIKKGAKLLSNFKFLQKYLTESQFLKAVSAHFYGTVFYACPVWYDSIKACYKNKLKSLHFRLLRTACHDHHQQYSKEYLSKRCRRATPDEWVRYCSASLVIKTIRDKNPKRLHSLLMSSYFEEPRKAGVGNFFDKSASKVGKQSINCRLDHIRLIKSPWSTENLSNDSIRILLKRTYFDYFTETFNSS